ncbi:unnamed protein product [Heligmosomoides polygyrus]|uniref:Autophagy-related protein 101 n=1 Tax=Heligmosomoides polygyrus TaxID=6339 RepID=A0A183F8D0_HELPZ|nr:unnamed protein product [Heligmosomoides polygyrus]
MNARQQEYRLSLELLQVNDAVSCIFHSLLAHRSVANFQYKGDSNYSLGSLGIREVECENIDLTYVKINSDELSNQLDKEIRPFLNELDSTVRESIPRSHTPLSSPTLTETAVPLLGAQISLEFFQRRPPVSWERWVLLLDICRSAALQLSEQTPVSAKMPTRTVLSNVFDSNLPDCQPYLFKVCRVPIRPEATPQSGLTGMRRYIRDLMIN